MTENSKFYSAIKSARLMTDTLPHVTIQCPVYKESLDQTIMPTVQSIKAAMSTYELQGGSCNMFINDDGLQLIPQEERDALTTILVGPRGRSTTLLQASCGEGNSRRLPT